MNLFRRQLVRNTLLAVVLSVGISETLILQWWLLVSGRPPLGAPAFAGALVLLLGANFLLLSGMRLLSRRYRQVRVVGHAYMLATLGALLTGPLLVAAFVAVEFPVWIAGGAGDAAGQRALGAAGGAAIAVGFASILWGRSFGQRRVAIEKVRIPMPVLPGPLRGLRIAHLSDLHIGPHLRAPRLRSYVDRVSAIDPDLIVITGDLFDFDPEYIEEGCRELARLSARHGVFAILGNHDLYTGADAVAEGLAKHTGIRLLRDECVAIEIEDTRLYLLGVDDPGRGWTDRDSEHDAITRLVSELPAEVPHLLLAHRPSFFRQAARLGIPLTLAGHTHGGQIALPGPGRHLNISRLISHWTRGLFREGRSLLYVSRGLGVAGIPVRLNCPREIALLQLEAGGATEAWT